MKSLIAPLVSILVVLFGACGGSGDAGYGGRLSLGTDVAMADVDGDGRPDVVTLSYLFGGGQAGEGRLAVYRQTSPGLFGAAETYVVGCYPWSMSLADIDGDGRQDLVVTDVGDHGCAEPRSGNAIYLLRQDPAQPGRFMAPQKLIGGVNSYQVAVGDFNGDGAQDIATGGLLADRSQLLLLLQDPMSPGTFKAPTQLQMPGTVTQIVAGDIDGDGRPDLFFHLHGASGSTLATLLQLPTGGFGLTAALAPQVGLNVQRLAIIDVNGDGLPDLMAHFQPQSTDYSPKLTVLLQRAGAGSWSAPVDTSLAGIDKTGGTAFGDLDADGRPDVALAGSTASGGPYGTGDWTVDSRVNLILRSSDAGYRLAGVVGLPAAVDRVAVGDLDADGRNDIVLFGGASDVLVMLQSRAAPGNFGEPRPLRWQANADGLRVMPR